MTAGAIAIRMQNCSADACSLSTQVNKKKMPIELHFVLAFSEKLRRLIP